MALCFVSIGSNVEREQNIRTALASLRERYGPLLVSSVYETLAVGFEGAPFYNLVVAFATEIPPQRVATILRDIESRQGRTRAEERFGPRTLDLDLLLYGNEIIREPSLELPRPEIGKYAFVLEPLAEVAPDLGHPRSGRCYRQSWQEFDKSGTTAKTIHLAFD